MKNKQFMPLTIPLSLDFVPDTVCLLRGNKLHFSTSPLYLWPEKNLSLPDRLGLVAENSCLTLDQIQAPKGQSLPSQGYLPLISSPAD